MYSCAVSLIVLRPRLSREIPVSSAADHSPNTPGFERVYGQWTAILRVEKSRLAHPLTLIQLDTIRNYSLGLKTRIVLPSTLKELASPTIPILLILLATSASRGVKNCCSSSLCWSSASTATAAAAAATACYGGKSTMGI